MDVVLTLGDKTYYIIVPIIKNNQRMKKKIQSVHYENFITLLPRTAESNKNIILHFPIQKFG